MVLMDLDQQQNITEAKIEISGRCDSLSENITVNIPHGSGIVQNSTGPCIVLTGSGTLETYRQILLSARYHDGAEEPDSSDRVVVFTVSDGVFDVVANISLRITTVDDNPTILIVNGSGNYAYTEGGSPTVLAGLSLVDEDSGNSFVVVNSVTVQIVNGSENEFLQVSSNAVPSFTVVGGGQELILQGPAPLQDFQLLLQTTPPTYSQEPSTEPPCPLQRAISVSVNSTGGHGAQYLDTLLAVVVTPLDSNPPVVTASSLQLTYTENTMLYVLEGVALNDSDQNCQNPLIIGARVEITTEASDNAEEILDIGYSDISWVSGNCGNPDASTELQWSTCTSAGGQSILMISGAAPISVYEALLSSVRYSISAIEPDKERPERQLEVTVWDPGYNPGNNLTLHISVISVNDEHPRLDNTVPTVTYREGGGPVNLLSSTATLYDDDNCPEHQLVSEIRLRVASFVPSEDTLLDGEGREIAFGLNGSFEFGSGVGSGFTSGFGDWETEPLQPHHVTLTCDQSSYPDCYNNLLRSLQYNNTADEPSSTNHTITIEVEDMGGLVLEVQVEIVIEFVNDNDPELLLDGSNYLRDYQVDFFEGQDHLGGADPVSLSDNLLIVDNDADPQFLSSATINIQDSQNEDILILPEAVIDSSALNISLMDTQITATGIALVEHYVDLLSNVMFVNNADEPGRTNRTIVIELVDDRDFLVSATVFVTIIPTNDPAIFNFNRSVVIFDEMSGMPVNLIGPNDTLIDPDGNFLAWVTVEIGPSIDDMDVLSVDLGTSDLASTNSDNNMVLTITGNDDFSVYNTVLRSLMFDNQGPGLSLRNRSIYIVTFDGETESPPTLITVTIDAFDDSPVCYFNYMATTSVAVEFLEESAPILIASGFRLRDYDSPDTLITDLRVTLTLREAIDGDSEGIMAEVTGGVIMTEEQTTEENTREYTLSNGSSLSQYEQVLRTLSYFNTETEPRDSVNRQLSISVSDPGFQPCSVDISILNIPDPPVIHLPENYTVAYAEDSIGIFPLNTSDFSVSDDDSVFLFQATLTAGSAMGVSDQFLATGNDMLRVDGSGSNQLTTTAIGSQQFFTLRDVFVDFLKTVMYVTDDQTGSSEHSISLVVQEFPLESMPPSLPGLIRVVVLPVNDRPVLLSTQRFEHNLTDYLPQSANEGFTPSFIIDNTNVLDIDSVTPAFVGVAITAVTDNGRGSWMVWDEGTWVPLFFVSDCSPQLVSPDERIRFVPSANHSKTATQASIVYRAWDGTSLIECDGDIPVFSNQSAVSAESETFTYHIEYLNRAPVITLDQYTLPNTLEDSPSDAVVVGTITETVASDSDDMHLGLAVTSADSSNGVWEYQSMGMWVEFPTWLSPQSLLLLANDKQIRFVANSDFFGTAYFNALAWDMSGNINNAAASDRYTGAFSTNTTTIFIDVDSINDPPVVEVGVPVVEYTEGGPSIQIFRDLSISDVDSEELEWTEVVLDCPMCSHFDEGSGDIGSGMSLDSSSTDKILTRHAPPNFLPSVVYSDSMRTVLRVQSVVGGSPAEFVVYLESLHFASTSREPSNAPRTVGLRVSDSLNTSNIASVNISIVLINDEPPMLTLPYPRITWTEDSGNLQIFTSPVTITDPDNRYSLLDNATLELRNYDPNFESLSLNCSQFGLLCSYNDGVVDSAE
ncbi:hypothetical protein GBAR_LOCUS27939 [Geodia barretti]|nr:hypothetical protein GBAR_LOCUS27939 [Geodia barretti]